MKKIFNTYNNPAEYIADTKEPNSVSLVKGDNTASDKVFFDGDYRCTQDKNEARVGDIVCCDDDNSYIWYMSPSYYLKHKDTPYEDFYYCVGVVVITPDEDNDSRKIHIVACKYMDYNSPAKGSVQGVTMKWGYDQTAVPNLDIINTVSCVVPGTTTISSNNWGYAKLEFPYGNVTQGDADVHSMWKVDGGKFIPSPYDHSLQMIADTANDNEGASLNGRANTDKILAAVNHTGNITDSSDVGHYPAAECCNTYTLSFIDENDIYIESHCYLPSAKELLYLAARLETINASLMLCGMSSLANKYFWSSTQFSSNNAYYLRNGGGYLRNYNKSGTNYVLGFVSLGSAPISDKA